MMQFYSVLLFLSLLVSVLSAGSLFAGEVQKIYEYQGKEGVPVFTDQVKPDKPLKNVHKIKKLSPEEEAERQKKLEKIIIKDQEKDRQRALERKLEAERAMRLQTERELELERLRNAHTPQENNNNNNGYDVYWTIPAYGRPPLRPRPPGSRPPLGKPPGSRPPGSRPPNNRPPIVRPPAQKPALR